jgi:hypothetical protein
MTPLYIQAEQGKLSPLEIMDAETLQWIAQLSKDKYVQKTNVALPKFTPDDFALIKKLVPQRGWFNSQLHITSLHGLSHIVRVMVLALAVCRLVDEPGYTSYVVAASIHDIRRQNDNSDPLHGHRAADWLLANSKEIAIPLTLLPENNDPIIQAVTNHQVNYEDIDPRVLKQHQRSIDILKAADALDRFRMPKQKWWPQAELIHLQPAHTLLETARLLTIQSEQSILEGADQADAVMLAAHELFT